MRKVHFLSIFSLLSLLCSFFTFSGITNAAAFTRAQSAANIAPPGFSTQLVALQKRCTVVDVSLHKSGPTMTCASIRPSSIPFGGSGGKIRGTNSLSPSIYRANYCPDAFIVMSIINYNYSSLLCFDADLYLGPQYMEVGIDQVNVVTNEDDYGQRPEWFLYYNSSGGHYQTLLPFPNTVYFTQPTDINKGVYITQLCYGSGTGGVC